MNPSTTSDVWPRIVNGLVVIAVLGIAAYVFNLLGSNVKDTSFGAFTTLVGTALAAYFGISATREAGRNAIEAVSANSDKTTRLAAARDAVNGSDVDAAHPDIARLRTILGS
jgi:hypothetical protein